MQIIQIIPHNRKKKGNKKKTKQNKTRKQTHGEDEEDGEAVSKEKKNN